MPTHAPHFEPTLPVWVSPLGGLLVLAAVAMLVVWLWHWHASLRAVRQVARRGGWQWVGRDEGFGTGHQA